MLSSSLLFMSALLLEFHRCRILLQREARWLTDEARVSQSRNKTDAEVKMNKS
jgi:hypothetical protein